MISEELLYLFPNSERYASLDTFFVPDTEWASNREAFFAGAGLPVNPDDVPAYLTNRLNQAYDRFLESLPDNQYVQLDDEVEKAHINAGDGADSPFREAYRNLSRYVESCGWSPAKRRIEDAPIEFRERNVVAK